MRKLILAVCCAILPLISSAQTIVVDNADPGFSAETGIWETGTATGGKFGPDYRFALASGSATPTARCRFTPNLPETGYYYVSVWYNVGTNRAIDAPYTVYGDQVTSTVEVNQQLYGSQFFYIGQMHFAAGTGGSVTLENNANNPGAPSCVVMADAVQFEYAGTTPGPEPGTQNPGPGEPEDPELRGLWVSRFEWPRSNEFQTKQRLDEIITRMAAANFNAIFLQVRGAMETFYPSPNEPWAKESFNYQPQPYDPMEYAIEKTHQAGMQFHAYINTHAITQGATEPVVPGGQPTHPFFLHGNPNDPMHKDWVYHLFSGQPQPLGQGEDSYNWAAPGVPGFQQWTREQVLYVAENYDVDGVHFDRIRFAGSGSYDPISLGRSAMGTPSNPDNLGFRDWNRDQVTRLLNDMYGAVAEVNYNRPPGKPFIAVSTAPFRAPSQQASVNQMVGQWNALGAQDFSVPQIYTSDQGTFEAQLQQNQAEAFGRHIVAGMSRNSTAGFDKTRDFILSARNLGAAGTVIFSYTAFGFSELDEFANTIYRTKVEPRAMDWVTTPTQGIIVGTVTGPGDEPVLDAQIRVGSGGYTWLSGADGFYAMLKMPAGDSLNLNVSMPGQPEKLVTVPALQPGEVRRVDISFADTAVDDWMVY